MGSCSFNRIADPVAVLEVAERREGETSARRQKDKGKQTLEQQNDLSSPGPRNQFRIAKGKYQENITQRGIRGTRYGIGRFRSCPGIPGLALSADEGHHGVLDTPSRPAIFWA
jgi:hypothetical protein